MKIKSLLVTAAAGAMVAGAAAADPVNLRIQTHHAAETPLGRHITQWADDVNVMSGGDITVEMFFSSSVVIKTERGS